MDQSSISENRSTFEDRLKNITYLRNLYMFFALELVFVLIISTWALFTEWPGAPIVMHWRITLISDFLIIVLILVATFWRGSRDSPINYVIYGVFTISLAYTVAYLCRVDMYDGYEVIYYCLWILTAISIAFYLYAL